MRAPDEKLAQSGEPAAPLHGVDVLLPRALSLADSGQKSGLWNQREISQGVGGAEYFGHTGPMSAPEPRAAPNETIVARVGEHIESFYRALDLVARERKYLTLLEAPPLQQTRDFVLASIRNGDPQFVALAEGEVVGWCDIRRHFFPAHAHRGTLGMGIIPAYRGRGLGMRLLQATLDKAFAVGLVRIEFDVHADNARALHSTQRRASSEKALSATRFSSMGNIETRLQWRLCVEMTDR